MTRNLPDSTVHADGPDAPLSARELSALAALRRTCLEALPIPTAVVEHDGSLIIDDHNALYDKLRVRGGQPGTSERLLDRPELIMAVERFLEGSTPAREFDWIDGDEVHGRHYRMRIARLQSLGRGRPRALFSAMDRTAEIQTQRSLRAEMLHDSLTGLPNRAAFAEAVADAGARMEDGTGRPSVAVLIVNLTRFSRVNECMGSMVGDELIITFARRLVGAVRGCDMLARIGGDEFGILLTLRNGVEDATLAARRIQATLSTPFRLSDLEIRVECAIGCALPDERLSSPQDLFRNAQFAVKRAKESGQVERYQPGEVNAVRRRFSLETELRRAIENDRLTLAYQPLIDLGTGQIAGFEALARWDDPNLGPIGPAEFIPVAEECGLILPLGRWAIETAARTLIEWDRAAGMKLPIRLSVNVSAVQIQRDDIAAVVAAAQSAHAIEGRLKLELTESCIVADPERAMRVLGALKAQDVQIAMDDFGTGHSSLAYLQRLPIDELKIDRSFVTPMLRDRDSLAIVRAVLSLADALGMRTIAEGVETVELSQTLGALGCTMGQGWHYSRPLAAPDALAFWAGYEA